MIGPETTLQITFLALSVVGVVVLASNWQRASNQAFLVLTLTLAGWLGSVLEVFHSNSARHAADWIRITSIVGGFSPVAISLLRASIVSADLPLWRVGRQLTRWLIVYALVAIYCLTPLYLAGAEIHQVGIPDARYGTMGFIYPIYMLGGFLTMFALVLRDVRRARGLLRAELEYLLAGVCCFFGAGIFACVVPLIAHNSQIVSVTPLWFIVMSFLIAYGIATRSILSVGSLLRRGLSYLLLLVYLSAIYFGTWFAVAVGLHKFSLDARFIAPVAGTAIVALTMARAQSLLQLFVQKLFINLHQVDLRETLKRADRLLTQVMPTEDLLNAFTPLIGQAAGTDRVTVCLFNSFDKRSMWSSQEEDLVNLDAQVFEGFKLADSPLTSAFRNYELGSNEEKAASTLASMSGALSVAINSSGKRSGVVILGEKRSGRAYDREEQESIQLLANRLGTAIENSHLYTEQQKSKEYLQSLLGELTSGVVACDVQGRITVCNDEAERLLKRRSPELLGSTIEKLSVPLGEVLLAAIDSSTGVRDGTGFLKVADIRVPVRYSSQRFSEGAFVVFNDLTEVKKLEEQLRRSDRLAVLGTLAAGLAHEIRNPLAPIKTFVELMPERAEDPDFRQRFIQIVSSHVSRIEKLVNQLLSFSRSRSPQRSEVGCHAILDDTLALLRHDLAKKGIAMETQFRADLDVVLGDRQQLEQVVLNTVMNAGEAMASGGVVAITTDNDGGFLEIRIADGGPGIPAEVLPNIFDPFVTTKETGTGLGLSIVYGIIADHSGTVDVLNSEDGATIRIRLPLVRKTEEVA